MKKTLKLIFAMALILSVTLSIPVCASAEVNNNIKTTEAAPKKVSGPSPADIKAYGDDKNIKMPKAKSYLDNYTWMYVDAPKGHSVKAYTHSDLNDPKAETMPYAYHGSQFCALAVENGFVCGIYPSDKNEYRVAWVNEEHLSDTFPGTEIFVGEYDKSKDYKYLPGAAEWSKLSFVGTKTKYSNVIYHGDCPDKLDGIVIEYQVISRNGKGDVSGMRDVYINDGSGWELVTSYDLDPYNQTVRVYVMFDEPTEVKAVATIPQDSDLEGFVFRQTIPGLIYID